MKWRAAFILLMLSITVDADTLRVASIQFESIDGAFDQNLQSATRLIRQAKARGAELALLPEFSLIGYTLSEDMWRHGEKMGGPTQAALAALAISNGMYLATTLLEVDGEHFFNTFVLLGPDGDLLGAVRKQKPAGAEGYFFRGDDNPHTIPTPLGRIGVGICQENYRCFLPQELHTMDADLVLMPFSYPDLSASGGLGSPAGAYIASWYATQLGIPVVTSNKTGTWPQVEGAYFPGASTIAQAGGTIAGELDANPGVLVVDITLDETQKRAPSMACVGPFIQDLTLGSWLEKRLTWIMIWIYGVFGVNPEAEVERSYADNHNRRAAALDVSSSN
ncbi:MAG: carbon-nitrogen hydrolase family protein [Pseudomonadota bacterium]